MAAGVAFDGRLVVRRSSRVSGDDLPAVRSPHNRGMDDRALLEQLIRGPATGDALARAAGQTRAAVWKRIEALRQAGIGIAAQPGRGYSLSHPLDLLEAAAIRAALPQAVAAQVANLEVAWSIDSTNSELLRRGATEGVEAADILLAERQTGGRGRRGRVWASPLATHLYLSLARGFGGGLARLGGLSLVAGVAAAEALQALGFDTVRLKWPNDIVVVAPEGLRKLGGLLIEGSGEHAGPARAVIGLGLNVRMPEAAAQGIDQPWCDLAGLLADSPQAARTLPDRNAIAAAVLKHVLPALELFDAEGLAPFLPRYAALDALKGQAITLHTATSAQAGIASGIAEDGALRLRLPDGREQRVHAGEVSVRRAAAA
jgi:BirA family transcriptional regulator, biotin operon repressor / biotin---[acetyl-CoA-carboxylase] ligase